MAALFLGVLLVLVIGDVAVGYRRRQGPCGRNQMYFTCASPCITQKACDDMYPKSNHRGSCLQCMKRCICRRGYVLQSKGSYDCVRRSDCSKTGESMEYYNNY